MVDTDLNILKMLNYKRMQPVEKLIKSLSYRCVI